MIKSSNSKFFGESVLMLVTLLWGGTFVVIKNAVADISPILFVGIRFTFATILFLIIILFFKKFNYLKNPKAGLLLGVLMFFAFAFQTVGLQYTTVVKSGFITGTVVVLIPFFQFFIQKRIPTKGNIAGVLFVFIGLIFISYQEYSFSEMIINLGTGFNFGDFLTFICAVLFGLHIVFLDLYSKKESTGSLVFFQILITGILGLSGALIFGISGLEKIKFELTTNAFIGIFYTAVFATIATIFLQTKYQSVVTPAKAGIIYSFEPVFASILAYYILGENILTKGIFGAGFIFLGLIISETYENYKKMNIKCANILVKGLVQGVGFRYFIQRNAVSLNLKGYVRNLIDGDVEIIVEGNETNIVELFELAKKGPERAIVNDIKINWINNNIKYTDFEIKR